MQFFKISTTTELSKVITKETPFIVSNHGLPMEIFAQILTNIGENKPQFTMDDIDNLVTSEDLEIKPLNGSSFYSSKISKAKSSGYFAIVEPNKLFSLTNKDTQLEGFIFNNKLFVGENLSSLLEEKQKFLTSLSPVEQKVWEWLDSNKVGTSSLTLCSYLFPNFEHDKLQKFILDKRFSHPHDVADFSRCINFVKAIGVSKEDLLALKISPTWNNLLSSWETIEAKILAGDDHSRVEANNLIKTSVASTSGPKP